MTQQTQTPTQAQETTPSQGFYIEASFDRIVRKERKNRDGEIIVTYEIAVIVRTESDTNIYNLKTKNPDKYKGISTGQPLRIRITPRAYKDYLYFTIVE